MCQPSEGVDENPRWSLDGETQTSTAEQFRADTDRLESVVLCCVVLYCIVLYCIVSYRIMSCHVMSCHIISYHIILCYRPSYGHQHTARQYSDSAWVTNNGQSGFSS